MLFVCVHNAGRSQMAAALLEQIAGDRLGVRSAGTEPLDRVHPVVVDAMRETGIDLSARLPQSLEKAGAENADVVVTMGCGDTCPVFPGARYEDWVLDDPSGRPIEEVRRIRDDIERRVRDLADRLLGKAPG